MSVRPRPAIHRQRGQALTEMAVLAAVLVPLFLLIPMLAKYAHLRQATQQAARAAAWEATVVPEYKWATLLDAGWREKQRQLLIERHFGQAANPITTAPATPDAGADAPVGNLLLGTFSGQPLLERGGIELRPFTSEPAGYIGKALDGIDGIAEALPGGFPPNTDGLATAELVVRPRDLRTADGAPATYLRPFDTLGLEFRATHSVFADGWGAAGSGVAGHASAAHDRSVLNQVRSFVPSSYLGDIGEVLEQVEVLENIPLLGVPLRIRPGYIEPDIVPVHRLEAYATP